MTFNRAPAAVARSRASSAAARDSGEPSKPTPIVCSAAPRVGEAVRRHDDGALGAVQGPHRHVAGQHAADGPAVRRADDDEVAVVALGGQVQRAAGRAVGHGGGVRDDMRALELVHEQVLGVAVHDALEVGGRRPG